MRLLSRSSVIGLQLSVCLGFAGLTLTAPAGAQESGVAGQLDDIRNSVGLGQERAPIDFSERPPLVVPPTNNLPPPVDRGPQLGVNDPDTISRRKALTDSRRPVPPSDPGAGASGAEARTYLIDPPSGMRDPDAIAAGIETDRSDVAPVRTGHKRHGRKKAVAATQ